MPRRPPTYEEGRRICLYYEENKTAKLSDIAALFGVERSTVAKVLRRREQYLDQDDRSRYSGKRITGRVPDIEKALSNWARYYQRRGDFPLNDEMLKEKALFFASVCGCLEVKEKVLTAGWLDEFKRKNGLVCPKPQKGSINGMRSKFVQPQPPASSKPSTVSTVNDSESPTQDEARRALELVVNYFQLQPAGLAAQEYVTIGKLMERLEPA